MPAIIIAPHPEETTSAPTVDPDQETEKTVSVTITTQQIANEKKIGKSKSEYQNSPLPSVVSDISLICRFIFF